MKNLSTAAKMKIGYQFEVALTNGTKIMAGKGRQIMVTVKNDLFDVYAFTLKGINLVKEVKISGLYAEQLEEAIVKAAQA